MFYRWVDLLSYAGPIIGHFTTFGSALVYAIAAVACVALLRRPLFALAHAIATREVPEDD